MICCKRLASVSIAFGQAACRTRPGNRRSSTSATWRKVRSTKLLRSSSRSSPTSTWTVPDSIFDKSRMSLMRLSRSLPEEWIVLANSVCLRGEVAVVIFGKLVGKDQQAVERRPQLVRHVREELRLVFGGQGELAGLFFEFLAGLLDFGVLAFDLFVLLGQQVGLFLQLFVGVLQLLLPSLQLLGQRLRLLEQVLGTHVGFDRVEHDADRLGELVEKRLVRRIEALERGQLQHTADLSFEDQRQHKDASRRGFAEAGADPDILGRSIVQLDLFLVDRTLADESLADVDPPSVLLLAFRRIAGQQLELRRLDAGSNT